MLKDFDIGQIYIGRVYPDSVSAPMTESGASSYMSDCGLGYVYPDPLAVTIETALSGNPICALFSWFDVDVFSVVFFGAGL